MRTGYLQSVVISKRKARDEYKLVPCDCKRYYRPKHKEKCYFCDPKEWKDAIPLTQLKDRTILCAYCKKIKVIPKNRPKQTCCDIVCANRKKAEDRWVDKQREMIAERGYNK